MLPLRFRLASGLRQASVSQCQILRAALSTSSTLQYAYPKEGVFQQDSSLDALNKYRQQSSRPAPPPPPPPSYLQHHPNNVQDQTQQHQERAKSGRWRRALTNASTLHIVFSIFCIVSAAELGYDMISKALEQLELPVEPGSEEDLEYMEEISDEFDMLPIVQQLRTMWQDKGGDQVRVFREWVAYSGLKDSERRLRRLTTGPLAGTRGVAAQVAFWNHATSQLVLFVKFGEGTCGWPGVIHGGMISTIFDEAMGRVAIRTAESKTGVTANLEVNFVDKCTPDQWFMVHAMPDATQVSTDKKKYMVARLMCVNDQSPTIDGTELLNCHVHAEAKALFIVRPSPGAVELKEIEEDF